MRSFLISLALAALLTPPASAQLIRYEGWGEGPVLHLMTRQELAEWKTIRTDERAKAFVDLFWARRDPTPETRRNEFRDEFEARVALADEQFTSARIRGSMSDAGKVLILLGPPWQVSMKGSAPAPSSFGAIIPSTAPTDADGSLSLPRPVAEPARQIWTYAHTRKPKFIPQSDFVLVFLDEGQNEWQLAHTDRINPDAILGIAVRSLIVSPELTKARFGSDDASNRAAFVNPNLKVAFEAFRASGQNALGPAALTWGAFVTPEGEPFVASQLYAPSGSGIAPGQEVTLFTVIENLSGEIAEVHEEPATMIATGRDAYVDDSLHLRPGHYVASFGIARNDRILSLRRTELTLDPLDPAASGVSPLILSAEITPLHTTWLSDDPFTFGGLKVVPKGDATFSSDGNLWYFIELRNPGLTAEKRPAIAVEVEISGTTAHGSFRMTLPVAEGQVAPLKGSKDRYAIGAAIPLESFKPGQYTIRVRVTDTVMTRTYDLEKAFSVTGT